MRNDREPASRPVLRPTRRRALALGAAGLILPAVARPGGFAARAAAADTGETETYGLSVFGDLGLPKDFPHLPYVDPQAPKGGEIKLQITGRSGNQNFLTFNTLNIFNQHGDGAAGVAASFDSLMTGSADEPDALYGLVAQAVRISSDRSTYRFLLRKEARFADGTPLTAKDVKFSVEMLRDKGHFSFWSALRRDLASIDAEGDGVVVVRLNPGHARDFILFVAGLPIFSAAFYAKVPFDDVSLQPPLGSGAYKVGPFSQGKYIAMELRSDYWAKDLPINLGTNNFATLRFEYYTDRVLAFEAFKTGAFTFHEEYTARIWATGYDFPAVRDGRIRKENIPDDFPRGGAQGWFLNTRRSKFADPRIREAIGYAFDFKKTNAAIMFGAYNRTVSYFQNSPMEATGSPSPEELAALEPYRSRLPPASFGPVYMPPESDGSGSDRTLLRQALNLLLAAGCKPKGQMLTLPDGSPFEIEFLIDDPIFEPHHTGFIRNLKLLGIEASLRLVDAAQYKQRTDQYEFDVGIENLGFGLTPGAALRDAFGSEAARSPGSNNLSGISDPVVDALVQKALVAQDRETLTVACRCLDRVLRASHYWVPMWNKTGHTVAFWDLFGRPKQNAKYGLNVVATWWYDEAAARKTALPG